MLVGVHHELLHTRQDVVHDDCLLDGGVECLAEISNLVRCRSANLRFAVLQKTLKFAEINVYEIPVSDGFNFEVYLKSRHEVCLRNFGPHGLLEICELVGDHVPTEFFYND